MPDTAYIRVPRDGTGEGKYEVKRAVFTATTATDTTIVSGVTGKAIRILAFTIFADGLQRYDLNDGTNYILGSNTIEIALAADSQHRLDFNPYGWGETASGAGLVLTTTTTEDTTGVVVYCEV